MSSIDDKLLASSAQVLVDACHSASRAAGWWTDKLPHQTMREIELADAAIRLFDLSGAYGMDLGGAITEKMAYNAVRPDHKPENRSAHGGKTY